MSRDTRAWPDIGPNDLLVACGKCVDATGRHEGVFVIDAEPDGAIVGRLARRCPHCDAPPPFADVVERYLASWKRLSAGVREDPTYVMVHTIRVGDASWTVGRRVDVLMTDPRQ